MTISILTILVILETFVILLAVLFFLARRHSKLKKAFDKLLASMAESIFARLVEDEIDNTNERIKEILPSDADDIDLASNNDEGNTEKPELSDEDEDLKRKLTFRSAYLHAEINAHHSSDGDPALFWLYLAENISELMPTAANTEEEENNDPVAGSNEFIDEIMQELQDKLTRSTESNLSLQAMLDSLLAEGHLAPEHINTIKSSQADYHDLSQHVADLEQKIQNSLNIEITGSTPVKQTTAEEKTLVIEKRTGKVNTETNKLKDIIFDQGNKINNLLKQLKSSSFNSGDDSELQQQLEDLERSQKETAMCMEVLEMENNRLIEEIDSIHHDGDNSELTEKVSELEKIIEDKDRELEQLNREFNSIQSEYMAVYEKGKSQQ